MSALSLLLIATAAGVALAGPSPSYVNLAVTRGEPQHVASGFIYGIPDNYPNQIPGHW